MSIFAIWSIACIARWALAGSASLSNRPNTRGMTCQESPYRSVSQPQRFGWPPPARSLSQSESTSACVSQLMNNEMAGVKLYCGPPFNA